MQITSHAFASMGSIPSRYTCEGENINPPLFFEDVPEETKSFVLIMEDPDVPKNLKLDGVWDHWIVWNIPGDTRVIGEGQEPQGVVGRNTGGKNGYGGPCPPDREHRYFFKLYALDCLLSISSESTKNDLMDAISDHIIDVAELVGVYEKSA